MLTRSVKNIIIILVILCSTSFFHLSALGSLQKVAELAGIGIIVFFIILYVVYTDHVTQKKHFLWPIGFIILSYCTSVFMAKYLHNQDFGKTIFVQRALFYYFFYILLHYMKVNIRDLEYIFFAFGIIHIFFYLLQYFAYPTIIFDGYVREMRGTVRIYLSGADYMVFAMFISIQRFFRTNKPKYSIFALLSFLIFILLGGRQTLAIMAFVIILFLIFDRKVHSRFLLIILGIIGIFALFIMFQSIFEALLSETRNDAKLAEDYIRIQAAKFFLTDFMKHPMAYLAGNGDPYSSAYALEMSRYNVYRGYFISDLGIIGNYVIYGAFFIIGVILICIRALKIKFEEKYIYIKYIFIVIILSLIMGGGFAKTDTIVAIVLLLYTIDKSSYSLRTNKQRANTDKPDNILS